MFKKNRFTDINRALNIHALIFFCPLVCVYRWCATIVKKIVSCVYFLRYT